MLKVFKIAFLSVHVILGAVCLPYVGLTINGTMVPDIAGIMSSAFVLLGLLAYAGIIYVVEHE
jgi:hypothetical protein